MVIFHSYVSLPEGTENTVKTIKVEDTGSNINIHKIARMFLDFSVH
jgi:hypothetical protein